MLQKIKSLSGIQVIVLGVLLLMGIMFLGQREPYRWESAENAGGPWKIPFLQEGVYTAEVRYEGLAGENAIVIASGSMQNENGKTGAEYARVEIRDASGAVQIPFALETGSYDVEIQLEQENGTLTRAVVQSNQLIHKDGLFLGGLLVLAALALFLCFLYVPVERYAVPLALVALGLVAGIPLFSEGLLKGDDIDFHLTRLEGIYLGLAAGEFPVRLLPQQMSGYGGLTATMYPQLFLYPVALLRFLDVSLMVCYKCLCVLINVGTAFAAYYSAKAITKSHRAGMLMAVFYTFSAYRLVNLYFRAALGESLAMVFLPLVLWGTYEILWGSRRWVILVLGMTGVLCSHVLSVELCAIFMVMELAVWCFTKEKNQVAKRFADGVKAVLVTLLLNLFFLVPFLRMSMEPLQCFMLTYDDIPNSVAYFSQMFSLLPVAAGTNEVPGSTMGEMPLTVGAVLLMGMIVFGCFCGKEKEQTARKSLGLHCLAYGIVALLLASWVFPWEQFRNVEWFVTVVKSLQFTWRFLGPASLFLCVVAALGFDRLWDAEKERWICGVGLVLLLVTTWSMFDSLAYEKAQFTDKMELEGSSLGDGMYNYPVSDKFEPIQLYYKRSGAELVACAGTDIKFENYRRKGNSITVDVTPEPGREELILFPLYYYPGYVVTIDGEEVPHDIMLYQVYAEAPDRAATVEVRYEGFWYYRLAELVSALTFLGIVWSAMGGKRPGRARKAEQQA